MRRVYETRDRATLLSVTGRKSCLVRTTPVSLVETEAGWLLVAVYGVSDWSRNLEAAGRASINFKGSTTHVHTRRIEPTEAGPLLRELIVEAPAMIRSITSPYFSANGESTLEEWERESVDHPVFLLTEEAE